MEVSKAHRTWTSLCLGIGEEEKLDKTLFLMECADGNGNRHKRLWRMEHLQPGGQGVIVWSALPSALSHTQEPFVTGRQELCDVDRTQLPTPRETSQISVD